MENKHIDIDPYGEENWDDVSVVDVNLSNLLTIKEQEFDINIDTDVFRQVNNRIIYPGYSIPDLYNFRSTIFFQNELEKQRFILTLQMINNVYRKVDYMKIERYVDSGLIVERFNLMGVFVVDEEDDHVEISIDYWTREFLN